jgi:hypothetical protein
MLLLQHEVADRALINSITCVDDHFRLKPGKYKAPAAALEGRFTGKRR